MCWNHIFRTMLSWTFDPAGLTLFIQFILWRWNSLQDNNVDKRCKSICSIYTVVITHPWTLIDFPSLAATGPTAKKVFLFTRQESSDCRNTSSFSEVTITVCCLSWRTCCLLPPFFIFPLSFVLSPLCVLRPVKVKWLTIVFIVVHRIIRHCT